MADELKYIGLDTDTGLTLTAEIYGEDGVQSGAAIAAAEIGSTAIYTADMPAVAAGTYAVRFFDGTTVKGIGVIEWDGTEEVTARDLRTDIAAVPTAAEIYTEFTSGTNEDVFKANISSLATSTDVTNAVAPLATSADLAIVDANVDAILVDTDQLTAAGLATQSDLLTALLPVNNSLSIIDGIVDAILLDTDELQSNQGNFATATGFATPADITSAVAGLATQASVDVVDGIVDAILLDTDELQSNQGNFATATGFATPADVTAATAPLATAAALAGTPAAVYAEFTSGTNEDVFKADVTGLATPADITAAVAGLASQTSVDTIDSIVDAILLDTDELQSNQGNFATATGFATPADVTAAVAGLATSAALATVDSIVDAILLDTDELQSNQANFATATGFATPADITAAVGSLNDPTAAAIADAVWDEAIADHQGAGTFGAQLQGSLTVDVDAIADAVWDEPVADHTAAGTTGQALQSGAVDLSPVLTAIGDLNDFDPVNDTVARVALVDLTTANTDMRGTNNALAASAYVAPDNASVALILADTNELQSNQGNFATATGFATPADVTAAVAGLATSAEVSVLPTATQIYAEFTSGTNEEVFRADLQPVLDAITAQTVTLETTVPANVWSTPTTTAFAVDTMGRLVVTNLDVAISSATSLVRSVDGISVQIETDEITANVDDTFIVVEL